MSSAALLDETINSVVTRTYAYGLQRISENRRVGITWTPSFSEVILAKDI